NSSSCRYSFFLKSIRSGPFSWTKSAARTAAGRSAVNVRRDCEAPGARPNRSRAGHAAFTKRLSDSSASGAISVAMTSSPFAGNFEGDANSLHQVRDQDLRHRLFVDRRAIDGFAARRIAAVGPIEDGVRQIELKVDGFRQMIEQHLDIGAVRRALALRDVDVG